MSDYRISRVMTVSTGRDRGYFTVYSFMRYTSRVHEAIGLLMTECGGSHEPTLMMVSVAEFLRRYGICDGGQGTAYYPWMHDGVSAH